MARLLRSTTQSVLRKPTVVYPPFMPRPVMRTLAPSPTEDRRLLFKVQYDLRPPTVVGLYINFSVQTRLARWRPPAPTRSRLEPPLFAPPVAGPFSPVVIRLAHPLPRRKTTYVLGGPVVVGPAAMVFGPIRTRLVQPPASSRKVSSKLRPPTTLQTLAAVLLAPILTRLARRKPPSGTSSSRLRAPVVAAPAVVFPPIRVRLAQPPRVATRATSRLRPPILAVAAQALLAPIRTRLARTSRTPRAVSRLQSPMVVSPQIVFRAPPPRLWLARTPIRSFKSRLRPPTVVTTVFTVVTGYFQNHAVGQTRSTPAEMFYSSLPSGQVSSSSDTAEFDATHPHDHNPDQDSYGEGFYGDGPYGK